MNFSASELTEYVFLCTVVQTSPDSGPVLTLDAYDPDGSENNVTVYRIESSVFYPQGDTPPSPFIGAFVLRGEKGALYAALPSYQAYSGGRYELKVTAIDNLNSSLTDSQYVIVSNLHFTGSFFFFHVSHFKKNMFIVNSVIVPQLHLTDFNICTVYIFILLQLYVYCA